ncbi:hypothetical protein BG20_I0738 [Candidatus Nitrosarchaeum limnium BG20]|uniref:Uncharacterized protein n=1 Tax=Candidatus Nitrosarchaeum limnium BG20 TaxID=859192 RepID=S2EQ94_9ARCH|nr:hypothetical protein BG20_I0738 [Candidatus Nitrosarchaeum limnium BG20]
MVFKDEKLEKTFPFKDSVREYISVKKGIQIKRTCRLS